ncbi:MAG: heat-inducible transcriptional repressor HrcA [Bacillota bacterium]
MIMDERKKRILQAIIDDYIDTAEPIGSRTIARKYELGLSSATIRNEMADLEDMGYLAQPHTSAGRIPSDKGYRLYVDELMPVRNLQKEESDRMRIEMETRINELDQLLKKASAVLSRYTKYTSMAVTPQLKTSTIKTIQLVPIESGKAMVIVVTNAGIIRNNLIKIADALTPDMLIMLSNELNDKLAGLTVEQIIMGKAIELENRSGVTTDILTPVINGVADCIAEIDSPEVYVEGTTNIFNYPEFRDVSKAKEFMNVLDEKSNLFRIMTSRTDAGEITIRIGSENDMSVIKDCTLITANYNLPDNFKGSIGIIGPTRMEYSRVISLLKYMRQLMSEEINRLMGMEPGRHL